MVEENESSKNSCRQHPNLPQPRAPKRRVRRRYRKNHSAISFLRRFTIAVVLIDLSFAICESNLISTFFLFLTLSSTFEVKPENVIESYCYFQPSGNRMCEDYMQRVAMGRPNSGGGNGNSGGGVGSSTSIPATNHFPTVPTRPPLTENESYQLFLAYNQSLYDTPARFKLLQNLGDNCVFAKVYSKVAQQVFENQTGNQIPQRSFDAVAHQMSVLFSVAPPMKQLTSPSAPTYRREIPQVSDAILRGFVKKGQLGYQEGVDYIAFREKLSHSVEINQSPIIVNEKFKSLIQIKDFIRHRWKRSAHVGISTSTATATETSLVEPHTSTAPQKPGGMLGSMSSIGNTKGGTNKTGDADRDHDEGKGKHDGDDPPSNASSGGNAGGNKNTKVDGQTKAVNGAENVGRRLTETSTEQSHGHGKPLESNENIPRVVAHQKPEKIYRKFHSIDRESSISLKSFMKVHALLEEKGPRNILGLMESALYNNWKCFLESAKSYVAPTQRIRQGDTASQKMSCEVQLGHDLEKAFILSSTRNTTIPILGMDMNIFSPETYTKAETRKQAMAQIYHDYGSSVMGQLSSFTEMPVSRSLTKMHWSVKIYSLVWHVVICSILFYGSLYEDKTALNIWGLLNILTSLIHFFIEDWINYTFHPEKSAAAIWFFVVYGLYKPISILLVGTLASEILKNDRVTGTRGVFSRFWESVRGRRRDRDPRGGSSGGRSNWTRGCPVTGHFFLVSSRPQCAKEAEKGINGINGQHRSRGKLRMAVDMATVDTEGNLEMHVSATPPEGLETGVCIICGEKSKPIKNIKAKEAEGEKDEEKLDIIRCNLHYRCSPADVNPLTQDDAFTHSEDDDEDEADVVEEEDDSDSEDDDDNQDDDNEDDDNRPVRGDREEQGSGGRRLEPPPPSNHHPSCDNRNHHNHNMPAQQPELSPRADQGPRTIENCQASELPSASPPPTCDPSQVQLRNQIIMERSRRSVIDGLIIKPVPDRVDGLLDAPVLDGEHPHM